MAAGDRRPTGRPSTGRRRTVGVAAVWVVAAGTVLVFTLVTAVGPMVLGLWGTHGVHLGDLLVLAAAVLVAGMLTARLRRPD